MMQTSNVSKPANALVMQASKTQNDKDVIVPKP